MYVVTDNYTTFIPDSSHIFLPFVRQQVRGDIAIFTPLNEKCKLSKQSPRLSVFLTGDLAVAAGLRLPRSAALLSL
jgi:hypothetical protein